MLYLVGAGVNCIAQKLIYIHNSKQRIAKIKFVFFTLALLAMSIAGRWQISASLFRIGSNTNAVIEFSKAIGDVIEKDAIVVSPENTMVAVYYMHSHVIRGIKNGSVLSANRQAIKKLCDDCPIYMAVPENFKNLFPILAETAPKQNIRNLGTLYTLR